MKKLVSGNAYTFTAIEAESKLIVAWHLDKRTEEDTLIFLDKLYNAIDGNFPRVKTLSEGKGVGQSKMVGFRHNKSDRSLPAFHDESYRALYQSVCAARESLLSRKNELDTSQKPVLFEMPLDAYLSNPRYLPLPTA